MTNYEKYKDEIEKIVLDGGSIAINRKTNELCNCDDISVCIECKFNGVITECHNQRKEWLNAEYKEPEIDWTKVPKGTRVWVRDVFGDEYWKPRIFLDFDGETYLASKVDMWVLEHDKHVDGGVRWVHCKLDDSVDPTPYYKDK